MLKEIEIDASVLYSATTPSYCRNNADRIRWVALKNGFINTIKPSVQPVEYIPLKDCFRLKVEV